MKYSEIKQTIDDDPELRRIAHEETMRVRRARLAREAERLEHAAPRRSKEIVFAEIDVLRDEQTALFNAADIGDAREHHAKHKRISEISAAIATLQRELGLS